jgi:hypothetical protein
LNHSCGAGGRKLSGAVGMQPAPARGTRYSFEPSLAISARQTLDG